ncbi:ABC-three component system protein [Nocardioides sp. NPDC059952]|uniref:ABC-three component system protein n=1 Tax=Nocardioides sp. NPDC059952 TaxID=3347014 RepID=UPI003659F548
MSGNTTDEGVVLVAMPAPTLLDAESWAPTTSHLALTPEQRLSIYSDKQWEEFVLEWATTLPYATVARSGGANDHGVDVVGFSTESGFDGDWDCFQCKQYGRALRPGDALPEILKIVLGAMSGHYTWPRAYRFAAPKGYGTGISNLIHSPSNLRDALCEALRKSNSALAKATGGHSLHEVLKYIDGADFSIFGTVELHELITGHSQTRWHSVRFGVELPNRPDPVVPAIEPAVEEQRYISKLMDAYAERHGREFTPTNTATDAKVGTHYLRQRVAFYSAESLRLFARDSVPEGTFDALQQDVFDGVIDIHDVDHSDGLERLFQVTQAARSLAITGNGLLPVVRVSDRTGICHQLANEDRLCWCDE